MLAQEGDIFVKIVTTNQITAMTNWELNCRLLMLFGIILINHFTPVFEILFLNQTLQICYQSVSIVLLFKDTDCLTRQCFGTMRPFTMNITDNNWQPLIQMYRPLKCVGSFMWCCCLQEMSIMSPPGNTIGSIKQM
jgi:hypothetical protein